MAVVGVRAAEDVQHHAAQWKEHQVCREAGRQRVAQGDPQLHQERAGSRAPEANRAVVSAIGSTNTNPATDQVA